MVRWASSLPEGRRNPAAFMSRSDGEGEATLIPEGFGLDPVEGRDVPRGGSWGRAFLRERGRGEAEAKGEGERATRQKSSHHFTIGTRSFIPSWITLESERPFLSARSSGWTE